MSEPSILNRLRTSVYYVKLKESASRADKILIILGELQKIYPFPISKSSVKIVPNGKRNSYICFVNLQLAKGEKVISPDLFIKNRYKGYSGKVCVKTKDFVEILTLLDGNIEESVVTQCQTDEHAENMDVIISEHEIFESARHKDFLENKTLPQLMKKVGAIFAIVIALVVSSSVMINAHLKSVSDEQFAQKEFERQQLERQKLIRDQKNELESLKKQYKLLEVEKRPKMYFLSEIIYQSIDKNSVINSMNIEKDNFTLDITSKDSMRILSSFENDSRIANVQMNRTSKKIGEGRESVTFVGKFSSFMKEGDLQKPIPEQIEFYKKSILSFQLVRKRKEEMKFSTYAGAIRSILHRNNCTEEYMQFRQVGGDGVFECYFTGFGKNVLSFLHDAEYDDPDFSEVCEIKNLKIRRNSDNLLKTTIQFLTGINTDKEGIDFDDYRSDNLSPDEMGKMFSTSIVKKDKQPSSNVVTNNMLVTDNRSKTYANKMASSDISLNLDYVGNVKTSEGILILAKDKKTENIYRFLLSDKSDGVIQSGYCQVAEKNSYIANKSGQKCVILR